MNESEQKNKSAAKSIVVMLLLIAALVAGVELIFWGIETVVPKPEQEQFMAIPQENGRNSLYGLRTLEEPERETPDVAAWLAGAEEAEKEDTVYWLYRQMEDDYILYLPRQDRALTEADLTADEKRQEDGEMTLVLRIRTPEDGEEVEPEEQLLCIRTKSEKWRGIRVRVLLDGREQTVEKRVSVGPELHSVEEVYIGRF